VITQYNAKAKSETKFQFTISSEKSADDCGFIWTLTERGHYLHDKVFPIEPEAKA